jgi:hypothetical protein
LAADSPANGRLRNLPKISLGDSGSIPTQQATLDDSDQTQLMAQGDSRISNTGSFAPLGATGAMKPVGDELFDYHDTHSDIYLDDVEDHSHSSHAAGAAGHSPQVAQMPKSRARSFFGNLGDRLSGGGKRKDELSDSPTTWLGVDKDFEARHEGSQIGSWDNFAEDEEGWKGGAYGGDSPQSNQEALLHFSGELIDKEVWVVALGSQASQNAGLKSFLTEYKRELRNALIINLDSVGAGDLCYTIAEGTFRPSKTDRRLQNLTAAASDALQAGLEPVDFAGYNTDAAAALKAGARAISILGLAGPLPASWRWLDDRLDILDNDNIQLASDLVVEIIKSS